MKRSHIVLGISSIIFVFISISLGIIISLDILQEVLPILKLVLIITLTISLILVVISLVSYANTLKSFSQQITLITRSVDEGKVTRTGNETLDKLVEVINNHLTEKSELKNELEHLTKINQSLENYLSLIEQGDVFLKSLSEFSEVRSIVTKVERKLVKMFNSFFLILTKVSNMAYEGSRISYYLDEDFEKADKYFNEVMNLINDLSKSFVQLSQKLSEFLDISMSSYSKFDKFLEISSALEASWKKNLDSSMEAVKLNKEMFNEVSEVINTAKVISDISEQTLILAMNALIESSKVGDVGKGFAVIADEIRRLSENVSKFSKNITEKLQSIKGKSNLMTISFEEISSVSSVIESYAKNIEGMSLDARDSFKKIVDATESLSSSINDVSYKIYDTTDKISSFRKIMNTIINERIEEIETSVSSISEFLDDFRIVLSSQLKVRSDRMLVSLAIADHVLWVARLKGFIDGKVIMDEDVIFDHTKCRLGKWYYSEGIAKYSQFPEFKSIEKPHERLHSTGREIVEVMRTNPQKAKEMFEEIIKHSSIIVEGLSKMLERIPPESDIE